MLQEQARQAQMKAQAQAQAQRKTQGGLSPEIFKRPILIYSRYCKFSNKFLEILSKSKEHLASVIKICIDPLPGTQTRPPIFYEIQKVLNKKIEDVPTLICENAQYIFSGNMAFKWLFWYIEPEKKSLSGFNPNEMDSISDKYMNIENKDNFGSTSIFDASAQNYCFIGKEQEKIYTPEEESSGGNMDYMLNQVKSNRDNFDNAHFDQRRNIGNVDFNDQFARQQGKMDANQFSNLQQGQINIPRLNRDIDFTNPDLGWSGESNNNFNDFDFGNFGGNSNNGFGGQQKSQKQLQTDLRYEKIMEQRKIDDMRYCGGNSNVPNHKVNFQTGEIIQESSF